MSIIVFTQHEFVYVSNISLPLIIFSLAPRGLFHLTFGVGGVTIYFHTSYILSIIIIELNIF